MFLYQIHDIVKFKNEYYKVREQIPPYYDSDENSYQLVRVSVDTLIFDQEAQKIMPIEYAYEGFEYADESELVLWEKYIQEFLVKRVMSLCFIYENHVRTYAPVPASLLVSGDTIADYPRPFPLGDERLTYLGQQNEHEDWISLLCDASKSTCLHKDDNGRVWYKIEKEKTKGFYIAMLKELGIAFKLEQEATFSNREEAESYWQETTRKIKTNFSLS